MSNQQLEEFMIDHGIFEHTIDDDTRWVAARNYHNSVLTAFGNTELEAVKNLCKKIGMEIE